MNYNFNPYFNYQQPIQQYIPLTFVNGEEEARRFIVEMNKTVYLRDSDSNAYVEQVKLQVKRQLGIN